MGFASLLIGDDMTIAVAGRPTILLLPQKWSKAWWLYLVTAILFLLFSSVMVAYASGWGGYISEKVIGRSGVADSNLLIGRSGVASSGLDVAMSGIVAVTGVTNVYMDGAGTHATLSGNLADLNGFPTANVWFEWGYDTSYGHSTAPQAMVTIGAFSADIAHFNPSMTVFYRAVVDADGTNYSGASSFLAPASGIISGFNLTTLVAPLTYMAMIILSVVVTARKSTLVALIVAAVEIYIGIAFMGAIQEAINNIF